MTTTSHGYDGTVDEAAFATLLTLVGRPPIVAGSADLAVTAVSGSRAVKIATGTAYGNGVTVVVSDTGEQVALPTPVNGQFYLIVLRRDWTINEDPDGDGVINIDGSSFVAIAADTTTTTVPTSAPTAFPTMQTTVGVTADQPLAWAWVSSASTAVTVFDLRARRSDPEHLPNVNARDTLPATRLHDGKRVWVDSTGLEYTYSGGYWNATGITPCSSTTRPAHPYLYQLIAESDTGLINYYNGTGWTAMLPARIGATTVTVTDWNTALDSGWYYGAAGASNSPNGSRAYIGRVIRQGTLLIQELTATTESATLSDTQRRIRGTDGTWGSWYRAGVTSSEAGNLVLPDRLEAVADTVTDWNTATDSGWYYGAAGATNSPNSSRAYLGQVIRQGTLLIQELAAITESAILSDTRRRVRGSDGTWGSWYRAGLTTAEFAAIASLTGSTVDAGVIGSGTLNSSRLAGDVHRARSTTDGTTDWNTLTSAGVYRVQAAGSANFPTGAYAFGTLVVDVNGNSVTQTYYTHQTARVYTRTKFNASDWTPWKQLANQDDVDANTALVPDATGAFTAASGWAIDSQDGYKVGGMADVGIVFHRTGGTITVPTTGDIVNTTIATFRPGWLPYRARSLATGGSGPASANVADPDYGLRLCWVSPSAAGTISNGDTFSANGRYQLASS